MTIWYCFPTPRTCNDLGCDVFYNTQLTAYTGPIIGTPCGQKEDKMGQIRFAYDRIRTDAI